MKQVSPQSSSRLNQEQRSQRGNYVGAETSELQQHNTDERRKRDPLASGGMLFCYSEERERERERQTDQFTQRKLCYGEKKET